MIRKQDRIDQTGEVFTPRSLIREMLGRFPNEVWFDPNKRWLEPAAGDGNFLVEIKARLLQAGHTEQHILENMLFSIELIDDNHWVLQHRLGYLINGEPNPALNFDNFSIGNIHTLTQDLNKHNPYHEIMGLERSEVLHHRNHVCWTALEYDMSFGRTDDVSTPLPLLEVRDLGSWPETDTPEIGEKYVVERMLGLQPQLAHNQESSMISLVAPAGQHRSPTDVFYCAWKMADDSPGKGTDQAGKKYIYALEMDGAIFYVGETVNARKRASFYADATRHNKVDTCSSTKHLQKTASSNGGSVEFVVHLLEMVDKGQERKIESQWIEKLRAEGCELVNATKPVRSAKALKESRAPKIDSKGGGWQVKTEWIGKGLKIQCKHPYDGSTWECDHDALVDVINASLRANGKPAIGEPGPSVKQYGASSGLRAEQLWSRI